MTLRSLLYRIASLLGDIRAAQRGPAAILKRIVRKRATRAASRAINRATR